MPTLVTINENGSPAPATSIQCNRCYVCFTRSNIDGRDGEEQCKDCLKDLDVIKSIALEKLRNPTIVSSSAATTGNYNSPGSSQQHTSKQGSSRFFNFDEAKPTTEVSSSSLMRDDSRHIDGINGNAAPFHPQSQSVTPAFSPMVMNGGTLPINAWMPHQQFTYNNPASMYPFPPGPPGSESYMNYIMYPQTMPNAMMYPPQYYPTHQIGVDQKTSGNINSPSKVSSSADIIRYGETTAVAKNHDDDHHGAQYLDSSVASSSLPSNQISDDLKQNSQDHADNRKRKYADSIFSNQVPNEQRNDSTSQQGHKRTTVEKSQPSSQGIKRNYIKIPKRTFKHFEDRFKDLVAYKERFGHCNVPQRGQSYKKEDQEYSSLGNWVRNLRQRYKHNKLSKENIQRLESVGFRWGGKA